MGETIAILIVFFFMVVFGLSFYVRIQQSQVEYSIEEQAQLKSIEIAQKTMFLPELQCSSKNVIIENCFDILKMEKFNELMDSERNQTYFDTFEFSKIEVKEIYPDEIISEKWTLYNREKILKDKPTWKTKSTTQVPISLYDPIEKKYYIGILTIEVYL